MRVILTDAERAERKRAGWDRILNGQRRPGNSIPKVDDVVEEFRARFGGATVVNAATGDAMETYFGLSGSFTVADLKTAFRHKIMVVHPDHGGTVAEAQRCVAFYNSLMGRF